MLPAWRWLHGACLPMITLKQAMITHRSITLPTLTLSLTLALLIVAIADMLTNWLANPNWRYVITLYGNRSSTLFPRQMALSGGFELYFVVFRILPRLRLGQYLAMIQVIKLNDFTGHYSAMCARVDHFRSRFAV